MHATRTRKIGLALILVAAAASAFLSSKAEAQQGTLSFTMEATPAPSAGEVIPKLTWATTPAATSCTASGSTGWTGTKAASGTLTLAAVTPPASYSLKCSWPGGTTAVLNWTAPTTNTDGSPLTNLAGYRVSYGASATALTQTAQVASPGATTYTVENLTSGTWFFAVRAYASSGAESANSNVASKTIAPPFEVTQSVGVTVPREPTGLAVE